MNRSTEGWGGISGGHIFEQTLNEAGVLCGIAEAYDLVYNSPALSDADHEAIRTQLILPMLQSIDRNKAGKSNWQTWHNAAMLWGGAVIGDASWVQKAISQPGNGFAYQMQVSVTKDGMWYENSWGYHFYTLSAMVWIAEGARRLDLDLWSHPSLTKMFTVPIDYVMPDGSFPRFGDDVNSRASTISNFVEIAWPVYRDPVMRPHLSDKPTWNSILLGRTIEPLVERPPLASKVFAGAGHAILRTNGDAGLAAALTFGPYGGFHGHFDKLSFVFYGHNKELGVDPGRARSQAYRLPIHQNWYKSTLSHNAVVVDGKPQRPASGKLELFVANERCAAVAASCDEAYENVHHRRVLCLMSRYLLVVDDLSSERSRRFDWFYHNRGSAVGSDTAKTSDKLGDNYAGQEYVDNVLKGTTDDAVCVRFDDDNMATYLILAPEAGTEVRTGDGVGGSVEDRIPMAVITRRGTRVRFAAVLEPVLKGQSPVVTSVSVEDHDGEFRVVVLRGDARDVIALKGLGQITVTTDGKVALSSD